MTLAYLQGRTNRQIAAMLGVSVSTVRRRLWVALEHLDQHVRRTGTWLSAILLLGLAYLTARAAQLGRSAGAAASADWPHKLAAGVAVGTLAAAGVGLVVVNHPFASSTHPNPAAPFAPIVPRSELSSAPNVVPVTLLTTVSAPATTPATIKTKVASKPKVDSDTTVEQSEDGDHGAGDTGKKSHKAPPPRPTDQDPDIQQSSG